MADKKDNVYQVKFKLIPDEIGFKSCFVAGIVLAKTQDLAISCAMDHIGKAFILEPFNVEIKIQSIVKLRQDFLFVADDEKKQG